MSFEGGLTLLAPLVAIVGALITRKVVPALAAGVAVGSLVATDGAAWEAPVVIVRCVLEAIGFVQSPALVPGSVEFLGEYWSFSSDHLIIVSFSILVAATVGVMSASGATRSLVMSIEGIAKGPRGAMVASWLAGMVVFFDDYANCLVVGNAMGPLCDRFRVSRAKLAYIVDSTAAPIASLALVSTWVGYEVGLVEQALAQSGTDAKAFDVFLQALPYRFYSIYTIFFVGAIAFTGRDFGPMAKEEANARRRASPLGQTAAPKQGRGWIAGLTVASLVGLTFYLMYASGLEALSATNNDPRLFEILGESDPYGSMFKASLFAFVLATVLAVMTRSLDALGAFRASLNGAKTVLDAVAILLAAWTLGQVIGDTNAANFIAGVLSDTMPVYLLPSATFLLAASTAFATGTSFGTMGILIPLVVPLAITMGGDQVGSLCYASTAAVLAGACLGDHASPISDTTVLSAIGAKVDLVVHMRTQLPYALTTGLISIVAGYVPVSFGYSPWVALPFGVVLSILTVVIVGRQVPVPS